ncbi:MAG: hypothetical protein ACXU8A_10485 [Burkholderiaceae bacterium]
MWILLFITALGFIASIAYIVFKAHKSRRAKRHAALISKEIILYFRKTGVEVTAVCANLQGDERFTALIESEPMKRFRLSHIIEFTLRDHIHKTCGLELECIYWRFPIKEANQHVFPSKIDDKQVTIIPAGPVSPDTKTMVSTDEYINEGLVPYKDVPKIEVTELSWEKFEEAATLEADKKADVVEPPLNE